VRWFLPKQLKIFLRTDDFARSFRSVLLKRHEGGNTQMTLTMPGSATAQASSIATSRSALITGRVLSGIAVLFLTMDAAMKLFQVAPAVEGTVELGYQPNVLIWLGVLQAACLILYLIPRTAVFGAVLWTGYLGGAIATHVRIENPLFTHILFPIYVAMFLWGGLYLRDWRVRAMISK
jgi:hypothetical protein